MKKCGRGGGRTCGDGSAEQGFLLFRRYIAHVATFSFALLFFQGRTLLLHHFLEKARLFLFGGESTGMGKRRIRAVCPMEIKFCVVQYRARAEAKL